MVRPFVQIVGALIGAAAMIYGSKKAASASKYNTNAQLAMSAQQAEAARIQAESEAKLKQQATDLEIARLNAQAAAAAGAVAAQRQSAIQETGMPAWLPIALIGGVGLIAVVAVMR